MQSSVKLRVKGGASIGQEYLLDGVECRTLGKADDCDVVIQDRGVSRRHCRIEHTKDGWVLVDLKSTNGVVVRGKQIGGPDTATQGQQVVLRSGDTIQLGEAIMEVEIIEPEDRTEVIIPGSNALDNSATELFSNAIPAASSHNPMHKPETYVFPHGQPVAKQDPKKVQIPKDLFTNKSHRQNDRLVTDKLPRNFRNYKLVKLIGEGGMGKVYLATDADTQKNACAIKFLKSSGEQSQQDRARFLREMEISLSLQHPSIIRCVDSGDEQEQLFIVMEYCNGGNLSELLKRSGKLTIRRAVRLLERLLSGVEMAHDNGIVHRDLKPSNILLHREESGKYVPKISDFGLAKSYLHAGNSDMTVNGSVGGSWGYMPKEQLTNFRFVSPQCDVWSMGAIFYECLTLKLPRVHQKGTDPIRTILHAELVPLSKALPDAPPELIAFSNKCLENEPSNRFANASEMRRNLKIVAAKIGIDL